MKYKAMVIIVRDNRRIWVEIQPFGGTIRFSTVSDADAFCRDYRKRYGIPAREIKVEEIGP